MKEFGGRVRRRRARGFTVDRASVRHSTSACFWGNSTPMSSLNGHTHAEPILIEQPTPDALKDLATSCVGFVERAVGVKLDFTAESLPLLDHYLTQSRAAGSERPDAIELVTQAGGAYLGEVVRRKHPCWWRITEGEDARLEFRDVYLSLSTVAMVRAALAGPEAATADDAELMALFEMEDSDRERARVRLADLPAVSEDEFFALSTRIEVLDIVVDSILNAQTQENQRLTLRPEDYAGRAKATDASD